MEENTLTHEKSTHIVEVVKVNELLKHENADTLSKVKVWDYTCIVRTSDWKPGDLGAFIPPDSLVGTKKPEFSFLAKKARADGKAKIRTEKLRGVVSYGLLVHAPEGSKLGDNVAAVLGVEHYDPEVESQINKQSGNKLKFTGGEVAKPPSGNYPKYDVDAFMKYGRLVFQEGEPVVVTEKIHGSSSKYVYIDSKLNYGSRTEWKKEYSSKPIVTYEHLISQGVEPEKAAVVMEKISNWKPVRNMWWDIVTNHPSIERFCIDHPGWCLYGESFGYNKGFNYGVTDGKWKFAAFDILKPDGNWLDFPDFLEKVRKYGIPHCPILHESIPFNFDQVVKFAEGNSLVEGANHIREGVVVHPIRERWDERLGRVKLKVINPSY